MIIAIAAVGIAYATGPPAFVKRIEATRLIDRMLELADLEGRAVWLRIRRSFRDRP
jgi:hypothetical protein